MPQVRLRTSGVNHEAPFAAIHFTAGRASTVTPQARARRPWLPQIYHLQAVFPRPRGASWPAGFGLWLAVKRAARDGQGAPVMNQRLLWRRSLTPGATRKGAGGSKAARRGTVTHGRQRWGQNTLFRDLGGRLGRSTRSAVLHGADLKEKPRVRGRKLAGPAATSRSRRSRLRLGFASPGSAV